MARFLFISAPLSGHIDWGGYLDTAVALQAAGHEVLWVSEPPVLASVACAGLAVQPVPATGWRWPPPPFPAGLTSEQAAQARLERALFTWLDETAVAQGTEALLDVASRFHPAVLVTEPFVSAAALAAEKLRIRLAVCAWPAELDRPAPTEGTPAAQVANEARQRVAGLCARFGLAGRNWSGGAVPFLRSPDLHITYFCPGWYAGEPAHLPQTRYAGGQARRAATSQSPAWFTDVPGDRPLVLLSMGSTFGGNLDFFAQAARACAQVGAYAIAAGLAPDRAVELDERAGLDLSPYMHLERWVDYDWLFPRLSAVLHHGGPGTTHRALCHALPQIIVPQAADQHLQAARLARNHAGLAIASRHADAGNLANSLTLLLSDPAFTQAAQRLQAELASLGGPAQAARWLGEIGG